MATFNASAANFNLDVWNEASIPKWITEKASSTPDHTSTHYSEILQGGYRVDFYGSGAAYDAPDRDGLYYPEEGIVNSVILTLNGATVISFTGLSVNIGNFSDDDSDLYVNSVYLSGSDSITLGSGSDLFAGFAGNDTINGGSGTDTAAYFSNAANYTVTRTSTGFTVKDNVGSEGTDTLTSFERLKFADKTLAFDIDANAGQAYRLYQAAFNRTPDNNGLKYWISQTDGGVSLKTTAAAFIGSAEFQSLYGANPSVGQLISLLYNNVLHRAPDQGGYDYWMAQYNSGTVSKDSLLVNFSESAENQAAVIGAIQNGIELI